MSCFSRTRPEDQLTSKLLTGFVIGLVLGGLGLLLGLGGIVAADRVEFLINESALRTTRK